MYILTYTINGITATAKNNDAKVLRNIIKCLNKEYTWELKNDGGITLDSSFEYFKGLPKGGKK